MSTPCSALCNLCSALVLMLGAGHGHLSLYWPEQTFLVPVLATSPVGTFRGINDGQMVGEERQLGKQAENVIGVHTGFPRKHYPLCFCQFLVFTDNQSKIFGYFPRYFFHYEKENILFYSRVEHCPRYYKKYVKMLIAKLNLIGMVF